MGTRRTRLRLGALPQCTASDAKLAASGAEAVCPASTRVGSGRAEGAANGAPVGFDLAVYAVSGRLFLAGEREGVPLKAGFAGVATGRRLVLTVPTAGGTISPTLFRARIEPGAWLRTPRTCPAGGHWTFRASFQGLDATGAPVGPAQARTSTERCRA